MTGSDRVVAFVPDLMDRSKVAAAATDVVFVRDVADLVAESAGARLVVVDLSRWGVVDALQRIAGQVRTIGFGSHVDTDTLDAARAAGCGEVLPRSAFFAGLPDLLAPPND